MERGGGRNCAVCHPDYLHTKTYVNIDTQKRNLFPQISLVYLYQTEIKMCKVFSSMSLDNGTRDIVSCPPTFFLIAWQPVTAHHPCHCSACEAAANGRSEHLGHPIPFSYKLYAYKCLYLLGPIVVKWLICCCRCSCCLYI